MHIKRLSCIVSAAVILCFVFGCGNNIRSAHLRRQATSLLDSEVMVDLNSMELLCCQSEIETDSVAKSLYRFVVYVDSNHCTSCELAHIGRWNRFVNHCDGHIADFMFIFHPATDQIAELRRHAHSFSGRYNVFLDSLGVFERDNELLVQKRKVHTFLLDANNRIVFVGDPTKDLDTQEAYLRVVDSLTRNNITKQKE